MEALVLQGIVTAIRMARRSGYLSSKTDAELKVIEEKVDSLIEDTNDRVLKKLDMIK